MNYFSFILVILGVLSPFTAAGKYKRFNEALLPPPDFDWVCGYYFMHSDILQDAHSHIVSPQPWEVCLFLYS